MTKYPLFSILMRLSERYIVFWYLSIIVRCFEIYIFAYICSIEVSGLENGAGTTIIFCLIYTLYW